MLWFIASLSALGSGSAFWFEVSVAFGQFRAFQFSNNAESNLLAAGCGAGGGAAVVLRATGLAGGAAIGRQGVVAVMS